MKHLIRFPKQNSISSFISYKSPTSALDSREKNRYWLLREAVRITDGRHICVSAWLFSASWIICTSKEETLYLLLYFIILLYIIMKFGMLAPKKKQLRQKLALPSLKFIPNVGGGTSTEFCQGNDFFLHCCGFFNVRTPVAHGTSIFFRLIRRNWHWVRHSPRLRINKLYIA